MSKIIKKDSREPIDTQLSIPIGRSKKKTVEELKSFYDVNEMLRQAVDKIIQDCKADMENSPKAS